MKTAANARFFTSGTASGDIQAPCPQMHSDALLRRVCRRFGYPAGGTMLEALREHGLRARRRAGIRSAASTSGRWRSSRSSISPRDATPSSPLGSFGERGRSEAMPAALSPFESTCKFGTGRDFGLATPSQGAAQKGVRKGGAGTWYRFWYRSERTSAHLALREAPIHAASGLT